MTEIVKYGQKPNKIAAHEHPSVGYFVFLS